MPHEYTILRVMHCGTLTSLKGVSAFVNLRELNVSSNGLISTSFLEGFKRLDTLNLSCNKLSQLGSNLVHLALRKLILSHNRLVSLEPLAHTSSLHFSLEHLDLTDNFLGDLE